MTRGTRTRGVSFEAMVVAMGAGGLLDVLPHPNQARYPDQRILVVAADRYAYLSIPYQTLIASVLHKYVSGRLIER